MANAVLSDEEKARIRYHMGYLQTDPVTSIQLGVPAASQPMFLVEGQMNRIPTTAIGYIRRCLAVMDNIDNRLIDALDRLQARKVEGIELREDETDALEREYYRWAQRLSDNIGAPLNPYSERFSPFVQHGNGPMPMNLRVV